MKNQVIRIIFDDNISKSYIDLVAKGIIAELSNKAAIEVYEEEFKDKNIWAKIMAKIRMMVGI